MIELNKFDEFLREEGWIKFENAPVYFQKRENELWEVYVYNQRELDTTNKLIEQGLDIEKLFDYFKGYSDHIYWGESYLPYDILCDFAASAWFGVDNENFKYYSEQYERLTGKKWNAGFVKAVL